MSKRILTSISDLVEQNPNIDNRATFERLWSILETMRSKIDERFTLTLDTCSQKFHDYRDITTSENGAEGSLKAYSGSEIDWFIHSFIGSPESTFTNMHITISLGPQYLVPNFGFALGTIPDLFWYMDYIPRLDLVNNIDYVDRYYTEVNEEFLDLQADTRFSPFISRDLYTRTAITPTAAVYSAKVNDEVLSKIERISHERLDRWLKWVDEAEKTPVDIRAQLSARDQRIRQNICERDPANNLAEKMFGKENADEMVKTLWGGNRTLPRPMGN